MTTIRPFAVQSFPALFAVFLAISSIFLTTNAHATNPRAAVPTFSPVGGAYTSAQTVTLSSATPGATIYYTANGSAPTTASNQYTGPFTVSRTSTVRAITTAIGYSTSAVVTARYTLASSVASPLFSLNAGTYSGAQAVMLSSATGGAVIYYTTDGSVPTASSALYTAPIIITSNTTVRAIAVAVGYSNSAVVSMAYTISSAAAAPTFTPSTGSYTSAQIVTISSATAGATIYYTTDNSTPTTSSSLYTSPITLTQTTKIKAIATAPGYSTSGVATAIYSFTLQAATPTFSLADGTYTSARTITISTATRGAVIYYTTDGSTPTTSSTRYTRPFTLSRSAMVKAIAVATGYSASGIRVGTYTITIPTATPTVSPGGGTYTSAQTVTISSATGNSAIYYTTDGSIPTTSSTRYTGPFTLSQTAMVRAIAIATGYSASAVGGEFYTINITVSAATPTLSPSGGTYTSAQTVTISSATGNSAIYYTTDGSIPTTSSARYTGPFTVNQTIVVKAIAVATGYTTSEVTSQSYTITQPATAAPTLSPSGGTYTSTQTVTIRSATTGAAIYYTTDGSTPTIYSNWYSGAFSVSQNTTVKAIAVATGYSISDMVSGTYTISQPPDPVTINQATRQRDGLVFVRGSAQPGVAVRVIWPDTSISLVTADATTGEWAVTSTATYSISQRVWALAYSSAGQSTMVNMVIDVYGPFSIYSKEECVKNYETGLIWEGKTASGLRAGNNNYTNYHSFYYDPNGQMYEATNTYGYALYVNSIALCGYTDWRLPTKDELQTLLDSSRSNPKINTDWFPNTPSAWYWTSSPYVGGSDSAAWYVYFGNGYVSGYSRNYGSAARLVRASQ